MIETTRVQWLAVYCENLSIIINIFITFNKTIMINYWLIVRGRAITLSCIFNFRLVEKSL